MNQGHFKTLPTLLVVFSFFTLGFIKPDPPAKPGAQAQSTPSELSKEQILKDHLDLMSKDFKVPEPLKYRVGFWFDIYSKYTSQQNVIHHRDYPWLIYKVVDGSKYYNGKGNYWTKYHRHQREVRKSRARIKQIIRQLLAKKSLGKLTPEQKQVYNIIKLIPGNKRKVLKRALYTVRTQLGQKDFIEKGLHTSSQYLAHMEAIFKNKGLPVELTRIPFVESSFNVKAHSKVGASGIWQFMPNIGRHYMTVNKSLDERRSPIKSTYGAAKLLKQNYRTFKDWSFAITAYNFGAGRLRKVQKKHGRNNIGYYISQLDHPAFGFASMNFYTSFMAALYAEKYKEHIYKDFKKQEPLHYVAIKLNKPLKLSRVYKEFGINKNTLQKFNLDLKTRAYKRDVKLPKGYVLHIPAHSMRLKNTKPNRVLYKVVYKSQDLQTI